MSLWARMESGFAAAAVALLRCLGPATSSNVAGFIAGSVGPLLPASRIADANLAAAMPELYAGERRQIVRGVWRNLGRTVGELPHLGRLRENTVSGPGFEIAGLETVGALAAGGGPAIFFSAHMGNWEMLPRAAGLHGVALAGVYRAAGNAGTDALIAGLRRAATGRETPMFAKGAQGARQAIGHLARGGLLALLVDQKLNDGIEARFFGLPAMTAPAAALFALRFGCPVVPAFARRIGPARLRIEVGTPLVVPLSGNRTTDILTLTQAMNDVVEGWIRSDPAAWLWLHRRWPYEVVPGAGRRTKHSTV